MTQVYDQIWSKITKCDQILIWLKCPEKIPKIGKKIGLEIIPYLFWRVQVSLIWKPDILCWVVFHEVPILRHIFHMSSSYCPHIVPIGSHIVPISGSHIVHPSCPYIVPKSSSYRPQEWSNFKPRFCPPLPQMRCQRPRGQGPWKPYHSALGLKLFQIFTIRWYMCILEGKCQWYLTG